MAGTFNAVFRYRHPRPNFDKGTVGGGTACPAKYGDGQCNGTEANQWASQPQKYPLRHCSGLFSAFVKINQSRRVFFKSPKSWIVYPWGSRGVKHGPHGTYANLVLLYALQVRFSRYVLNSLIFKNIVLFLLAPC